MLLMVIALVIVVMVGIHHAWASTAMSTSWCFVDRSGVIASESIRAFLAAATACDAPNSEQLVTAGIPEALGCGCMAEKIAQAPANCWAMVGIQAPSRLI